MIDKKKKPTPLDHISQVAIFGGALGMLFISNNDWRGFAIGLIVQPFWYYTSWKSKQWGVFLAGLIYTYAYSNGLYQAFK